MTTNRSSFAALALTCMAGASQAASIYVSPQAATVPLANGTATFDLMMDFAANELTVGGGIDVDVSGVATFASFTPSAYFTGTADPAFSGFGTLRADKDFEIHFGSFSGLSGLHTLGALTFQLNGAGTAPIALAINSFWGGFYSATTAAQMNVTMTGATLTVTVPEPVSAWLLLAGLGVIGAAARRSLPFGARHTG